MLYNKFFEEKTYSILIPSILIYLIPLALSTGPFIPDLFLSLVSLIFLVTSIYKKLWKYYFNPIFIFFILFWIFIVVVSLSSNNVGLSFKPSVTYLRFGIFCLALIYLINNNQNFLKYFFITLTMTFILVLIAGLIEIPFGSHLLLHITAGHQVESKAVTAFFGDEKLLGSYLSRLYPLLLAGFAYINIKNNTKKNTLIFLITFITLFVLFFTRERSAIFFFFITLFLIYLFTNIINYKKIFLLFLIIVIGSTLIIYPQTFTNTILSTLQQLNIIQGGHHQNHEGIFLFSNIHEANFFTAINIFKDHPITGAGVKMFREFCYEYGFKIYGDQQDLFCSTHPHNTYIQLLAETGVVGFSAIFSILIYTIYKIIKHVVMFFLNNKKCLSDYNFSLLICFLITLWPLIPTGNFFNNWLSVIYFLPIGFYLSNSKYYNMKNYD